MPNDENHEQTRFLNDGIVSDSKASSGLSEDDVPQPNEQTGFSLSVKPGALEVNDRLVALRDEFGEIFTFGSRSKADAFVEWLSSLGGGLRVQAAAPNDPSEADAYLLADHNPSIKEPADIDGQTWTFDVGANLYGSLGEAILLESPKPHALYYFIRQDLDLQENGLEHKLIIDVEGGRLVSFEDSNGSPMRWIPDCKIIAKDGWNGQVIKQYYCEIKTGNASFERSQVATMEELAKSERVLKIRMLIDDLPKRYSLRIHEVEPPD